MRFISFALHPFGRAHSRWEQVAVILVLLGISVPPYVAEWFDTNRWTVLLGGLCLLFLWAALKLFSEAYPKAFATANLRTDNHKDGSYEIIVNVTNKGPTAELKPMTFWKVNESPLAGHGPRTLSGYATRWVPKDGSCAFQVAAVRNDESAPHRRLCLPTSGTGASGGETIPQEITGIDGHSATLIVWIESDAYPDAPYEIAIGFDSQGVPSITSQGMYRERKLRR